MVQEQTNKKLSSHTKLVEVKELDDKQLKRNKKERKRGPTPS